MTALQNKTALVTGASRGIGRATAVALAEAGAHVLVHYGRSAQEAKSLVENIRAKGGRADAIRADLGTPEGATLLAKEVRSIVGEWLDVLVSNAGITKAATIKDHTVEDFDNLFATNVRSPFFLVQQLLPILGEGSNIIVISSLGRHARFGQAVAPCLRGDERSDRDSRQELGGDSGATGHSRQCSRPRSDRYRHVEFHEDRGRS